MHKILKVISSSAVIALLIVVAFLGTGVILNRINAQSSSPQFVTSLLDFGQWSSKVENISTTGLNQIILVGLNYNTNYQINPPSSPGLTFLQIGNLAAYYAIPPTSGTWPITLSYQNCWGGPCVNNWGIVISVFNGEDTSNPIYAFIGGTGGSGIPSVQLTTQTPYSTIWAFTWTCCTAQTAGTGFTLDRSQTYYGSPTDEYGYFSSAGPQTVAFGTSLGSAWGELAVAIRPAGVTSSTTSTSTTTSTTSSTTSTISTTSTSTTTSSMGGKWNYIITNSGSNIANLSMNALITSPLNGVSGVNKGNWTVVINSYAPTSFNAIFTQYIIGYTKVQHSVLFSEQVFQSNGGSLYTNSYYAPFDACGCYPPQDMIITLVTNSSGYVTSVQFSLAQTISSGVIGSIGATFNTTNAYSTPILAVNPVLVGFSSGQTATFISGALSVQYSASSTISWQSTVPAYVWSGGTINEDSNVVYYQPVQVSGTSITQSWVGRVG